MSLSSFGVRSSYVLFVGNPTLSVRKILMSVALVYDGVEPKKIVHAMRKSSSFYKIMPNFVSWYTEHD